MREVYAIVESQYRAGETVIAAHGLDLASRVFQDKHGAPMATVHFAPFAMMTLHETPRYIGAPNMTNWPRWMKAALFWIADRAMVDPIIAPTLNRLRADQGLPAVKRVYTQWNNSPHLVLGLFPDWFAAPQPDWPANVAMTGFPLWDPPAASELGDEVNDFLAAGEAPIVFAPGSANVQAGDFFQTARSPRHAHDQIPPATSAIAATGCSALRLRPVQLAAAAHRGAGATRRHRHVRARTRQRRSTTRDADGVRPVRQRPATGAAGRWQRRFAKTV
jgi:hypothetical protein